MKTFRFTLDRALHIRRAQLEVEQARLQQLIRDREQLERHAAELAKEALLTRRLILAQPLVTAGEIATMPDYQRGAEQRLQKFDRQRQDLLKKVQDQQGRTIEAERKVKLLEKLRGQRFDEWNSLMQKEQENFAADAYLARLTTSH
jgi:flagellar export protein FliJ